MAVQKEAKQQPALTYRQKQLMLSVLVRVDTAFQRLRHKLTPAHFDQISEKGLAVVWSVVLDIYDVDDQLPSKEALETEISARLEGDPSMLNDEQIDDVDDLLELAFSIDEAALNKKVAMRYAARMLEEYVQRSIQRHTSQGSLVNLPDVLDMFKTELEVAKTLDQGEAKPFFPEDIGQLKPIVIEPSGVPWLDYYMGGGMAKREVYGFLGPYGSCKTTLAVMLAINRVKYEQYKLAQQGLTGPYPIVYLVAWEEESEQLQLRAISYEARVHKDSLNGEDWLSRLSSEGNYKPYERAIYKKKLSEGQRVFGERERIRAAMRMLNKNLVNLDFTGAWAPYREASTQLGDGVAQVIAADQDFRGSPGVSMVVLDYAGAAAERAISARNLDYDRNLRHFIGKMPINCKNKIAIPFDCPVWIMHQTGTEAQSRSSGSIPKPTDAAEARNFLENLNFGFLLGTVTAEQTCGLACHKQRRAAKLPPKVLQIDGSFARVHDASERYVIGESKIELRSMAAKVMKNSPHQDLEVEDSGLWKGVGIGQE